MIQMDLGLVPKQRNPQRFFGLIIGFERQGEIRCSGNHCLPRGPDWTCITDYAASQRFPLLCRSCGVAL